MTRTEVVETFLYLIPANMRRYGFQPEDLEQEGVLALYRAVDGFDPERGLRFCTYAAHWMRQAAFSYMYDNGSTIRIPVYMRKLMNKIGRGEDPGDATETAIAMAKRLLERNIMSMDVEPAGEEGVDLDEITELVRARLNQLPERERRLVRQRYMQGRTLASVGREEGVSCERVRQIIQRGLEKLRTPELEELL